MVFNTTIKHISVISWRSALLEEEARRKPPICRYLDKTIQTRSSNTFVTFRREHVGCRDVSECPVCEHHDQVAVCEQNKWVFNTTIKHISAISWRSALLKEEARRKPPICRKSQYA
jgi:uncharacterized DUF497 family protein